jgi:hypothetical protein
MEPENLPFLWKDASAAAVLLSSGKSGEQDIALVRRLATDASARYPQLLNLRFTPISLPLERLENWAHLMAADAIRQWRTRSSEEDPAIAVFLAELGLARADGTVPLLDELRQAGTDTPLKQELNDRIQDLHTQLSQGTVAASNIQAWLEQEVAKLSDWFAQVPLDTSVLFGSPADAAGCSIKLQLYAPTLHTKTLEKLKTCFTLLRRLGSKVILQQLGLLTQSFQEIRADYEVQRRESLRRENSAWRAYDNLTTQPTPKWSLAKRVQFDWKATLRALNLAYCCKLEAETYALASQLVGDLIQQTHRYSVALHQTDTLLAHLQKWFLEHCPLESTFPSLLRSFLAERLNPLDLRRELEQWTGHPLEQWGITATLKPELLREQILARVRPVCLDVYGECCTAIALDAIPPTDLMEDGRSDPPTVPLNVS